MSFPATDQLREEHREMQRLLERFEGELSNPQGEGLIALAGTFAEIQKHLARHFAKEEEIFYPALAANDAEIAKLNDDHSDVRETSSAFQQLLDQAPAGSELPVSARAELSSLGWELWNLIHHHIEEEEQGLLAFADRSLDANTQARLAAEMRRLQEPA